MSSDLVHIPYNAEVHMTDAAKLRLCAESRTYFLVRGHIVIQLKKGEHPTIFNRNSKFINLMFGAAPGSLRNMSHMCYAVQK